MSSLVELVVMSFMSSVVIALRPYTHISARMDDSAVDRCAELAWARYKPAAPTAPAALADPCSEVPRFDRKVMV